MDKTALNAAFIDVVAFMHTAGSATADEVQAALPDGSPPAWMLLHRGLKMRLFNQSEDGTYVCRVRGSAADNWVSDGIDAPSTGRKANPSEGQVNARLVDIIDRLADGRASMRTLRGDATESTRPYVRPALLKGMALGLIQVSHDEDGDWFRLTPNK